MKTTAVIILILVVQILNAQPLIQSWARSEGGFYIAGGQCIAVDNH